MSQTFNWHGCLSEELIGAPEARRRHLLADAARDYRWQDVLNMVGEDAGLANGVRPGSSSFFAPLHQAAHGNAPLAVVDRLIELGAWRSLADAKGRIPSDIARERGHETLLKALAPRIAWHVAPGDLVAIENGFHTVIKGRVADLVRKANLRLPQLSPLLEFVESRWWFAVPGMYGGFSYWLNQDGTTVQLVSESWCRVAEGSGERHIVTARGSTLVDAGFV